MFIKGAFILPHPPLIVPEVGRGQERNIQNTIDAYEKAARQIAEIQPDTIVLATPHSITYSDYFHISPNHSATGDLSQFASNTPKIQVEYDLDFVSALESEAAGSGIHAGTKGEKSASLDHATVVPLYFINKTYSSYKFVRVSVSGFSYADHYRFGVCVADTAEKLGRSVVFIASADLSHRLAAEGPYGHTPEGTLFDKQITSAMAKSDFAQFLSFRPDFCEKAAECGLRPCLVMAGALDRKKVKAELLSYEGPFGVGYSVAAFIPEETDDSRDFLDQYLASERKRLGFAKENEDEYVRLARYIIEHYTRTGKRPVLPEGLPEEMLSNQAGVFVSLKKHGNLRGCIGTIGPVTKNIAEEISKNAVSAAAFDPRFDSVRPSELEDLVYSVDVLAEPEHITSPAELHVEKYGVIVTSGHKRGLLLPNLEGVVTVEQQIDIARQKAGISKNEPYELERFEVIRHK